MSEEYISTEKDRFQEQSFDVVWLCVVCVALLHLEPIMQFCSTHPINCSFLTANIPPFYGTITHHYQNDKLSHICLVI